MTKSEKKVVKTSTKPVKPVEKKTAKIQVAKTQARKQKNTHETKKIKPLQSPTTASKKTPRVVNPKKTVVETKPKFTPPGVGGRPPKYKTVPELEKLIDAYFESCWTEKIDMFGNIVYKKDSKGNKSELPVMVQFRPYTITGLALAIGTTRETLLDYEHKDKFSYTIKRAKERCQSYAEESLMIGKNPTGAIFNLKNNYNRWKDKTETEHSGDLIWREEPPK